MCWEVYGCVCLRYLALALYWRSWRPRATPRWVCVCARVTSRTRSGFPMTLARWPLAGDVALFPVGARLPVVDGRVRGDCVLVGGGGDAREVVQYAVKAGLKSVVQRMEVTFQPARARRSMVAVVVNPLAAAPHVAEGQHVVIRVQGGET